METGWIRLHRAIRDSEIWKDPVKLYRWLDILLTVNHTPGKVKIGLQEYDCDRGQSVQSLATWAKSWNCSKESARSFLDWLERRGMITRESLESIHTIEHTIYTRSHTRLHTRLSVCNYESYQSDTHDSTHDCTHELHTIVPPKQEYKNNKEIKNNKRESQTASKIDYSFIDPLYSECFRKWLEYKKQQFKFTYRSEASLKSAYNDLRNLSGNDPSIAAAIVDQSMRNGWKGLFALKEDFTRRAAHQDLTPPVQPIEQDTRSFAPIE